MKLRFANHAPTAHTFCTSGIRYEGIVHGQAPSFETLVEYVHEMEPRRLVVYCGQSEDRAAIHAYLQRPPRAPLH